MVRIAIGERHGRWMNLWRPAGRPVENDPGKILVAEAFNTIERAYVKKKRDKHTLQHLVSCLEVFWSDHHRKSENPRAVKVALWYAWTCDSGRASATLARRETLMLGMSKEQCEVVVGLIRSVRGDKDPETSDEILIRDIALRAKE